MSRFFFVPLTIVLAFTIGACECQNLGPSLHYRLANALYGAWRYPLFYEDEAVRGRHYYGESDRDAYPERMMPGMGILGGLLGYSLGNFVGSNSGHLFNQNNKKHNHMVKYEVEDGNQDGPFATPVAGNRYKNEAIAHEKCAGYPKANNAYRNCVLANICHPNLTN